MAGVTGGQVNRDTLVCVADAHSPFGYNNAAVLLQPTALADPVAVLRRTRALFVPERWWIFLSAWPLPDLGRRGLNLVGHPPLMLRLPAPVPVPQPPGLRIVAVDDATTCRGFDRVVSDGFRLPESPVVTDPRLVGQWLYLLVGNLDNRAVATAGACTAAGMVEVDWVATLPSPAASRHRPCHDRGGPVGRAVIARRAFNQRRRPRPVPALGFVDLLRLTI